MNSSNCPSRKKKKLLREQRKQRERVELKMDLPGVSIADEGETGMFSLRTIRGHQVRWGSGRWKRQVHLLLGYLDTGASHWRWLSALPGCCGHLCEVMLRERRLGKPRILCPKGQEETHT